jgi:hypothetical protein
VSPIKVNSERRRGDVPPTIVAGVLSLLLALFLPMAHRTPAAPTELPVLRDDPAAVLRGHREALALPAPSAADDVLAAWTRLSAVTARRDEAAYPAAQQLFAARVAEATQHARPLERAVQARGLARFLAAAQQPGAQDPTVALARRHRLVGAEATDAARVAWFLMRWERMALPTPTQGEVEPLVDTLTRLPRPAQIAFAAWSLRARCAELLGDDGRARVPDGARACARLRRDMIEVARVADPAYPRDEAIAATEMMLGAGLLRHVDGARREAAGLTAALDDFAIRRARDDAAEAFQRAITRYESVRRGRRSRLLERYEMAAVEALALAQ